MAKSSGGPAMAATPLIGEPLTMKAKAGPEPSAMSMESDAIACCSLASPAKAEPSTSRPFSLKKPLRMPMSSGVNENASGTALPTRKVSAACAGMAMSAPASAVANSVTMRLAISASALRQKRLGEKLAHVGLVGKRFHLDEGTAQHLERRRIEMAVIGEHRHQLVVDAARGRLIGAHHGHGDGDRLRFVCPHEGNGLEPALQERSQRRGLLRDRGVGGENDVHDEMLHHVAEPHQDAAVAAGDEIERRADIDHAGIDRAGLQRGNARGVFADRHLGKTVKTPAVLPR